MAQDVVLAFKNGTISVKFSKKFLRRISKELARKLAEELYYECLFLRYLPEIKAIEEKRIKKKHAEEILKI